MIQRAVLILISFLGLFLLISQTSCKSCNKKDAPVTPNDTTATSLRPSNTLTLPHADTTLVPILSAVLDEAFDASSKKDYGRLASLVVYRGPDERRMGYDVFTLRNKEEKAVIKTTAEVFNKWNNRAETREYSRAFELDQQPDGRKMPVVEVLFISSKSIDRKFFGFFDINGSYKIADVTSFL